MNKDFLKYRVFDTEKHHYVDDGEIELLLNNNGTLILGNWCGEARFAESKYIVERCVGYADKNGKLIYDGDIVEAHNGAYDIVWCDTECGWALRHRATRRMRAMNCFDFDELSVFSNIHEAINATKQYLEQKDVK